MTPRRIRQAIWTLTAVTAAACPALWAGAWLHFGTESTHAEASAISINRQRVIEHKDVSEKGDPSSLEDQSNRALQIARRVPLRRPLFDPPPVVVQPPPPPPLRIELLGTILEPGNSKALLRGSDGQVAMYAVGATVEAATIDRIDADQIEVTYHGESRILQPISNRGG